ncbi:hypothetical protein KQI65_07335 [bacterium]|nr:hypothetical protein [bacterium]
MEEQDLQHRINELQTQIKVLEERIVSTERRQSMLPDIPQTALLSGSFLTRAFAVLGHYLVAALIITIPVYVVIFVAFLIIGISLGSM